MSVFMPLCVRLPVLLLVVLLLWGCESTPTSDAGTTNDRQVNVVVDLLEPIDLIETFTLPAQVEARDDLVISAEIAGVVLNHPVSEGSRVVKGQKLLEIDSSMMRAQLEREQRNVEILSGRWERLYRLEEQGLVSRQEFDEIDNALTAARSALQQLRIQLEKSVITASLDGIVDRRYVNSGEYVDPGKPLIHLVRVDQLQVLADVPEKDAIFLKPGQRVMMTPAVIHGDEAEPFAAVIEHVAFVADEGARTYRTKMVIDQPPAHLRPGMIVRATFVRREHHQVLAVPLFAVLDRRGSKVVFVSENGRAHEREVVTGATVGRQVIIRNGLVAGRNIVVQGQQMLIDGVAVREVKELH